MERKVKSPETHEMAEMTALFALGALGQHEARALESSIAEGDAELRSLTGTFEMVVAALGLAAPERTPPPSLRGRLLGSLQVTHASIEPAPQSVEQYPQEFHIVRAADGAWEEFGERVFIKQLFVNQARGTTTSLLRILPGGRVPAHRHSGIEEIFVIDGDCQINSESLGPGDYRCAPAGSADRSLTSEHGTTVLVLGPSALELL